MPTQAEWRALSTRQRNHYHKMNYLLRVFYAMQTVSDHLLVRGGTVDLMRLRFEQLCEQQHTTKAAVLRFRWHAFWEGR